METSMKVAVLGAAGDIGQALALLLKNNLIILWCYFHSQI